MDRFENNTDSLGIAKVGLNLALSLNNEKSIPLINNAIQLYQSRGNINDLAFAYLIFSEYCLLQFFNDEKWKTLYPTCVDTLEKGISLNSGITCKLQTRLGLIKELEAGGHLKRLEDAQKLYENALESARREIDVDCMKTLSTRLQNICKKTNKCDDLWIKTNQTYNSLIVQNDSIVKQAQLLTKIFELNTLKMNLENKWTKIFGGLGVSVLVIFIISFLWQRYRQQTQRIKYQSQQINLKNEKIRNLELEKKISKAQEAARKAQLKPHFIANILNSIEGLINTNRWNEAGEFIQLLSQYSNQVLSYSEKDLISLDKEIELLETYIHLNKLRLDDLLIFKKIQIDSNLNPEQIKIPALLAQPDIENAIWHGIKKKNKPGHLKIKIDRINKNQIRFVIEDDGIGIQKSNSLQNPSNRKHPSLGTKIVWDRLYAINQKIGLSNKDIPSKGAFRSVENLEDNNNDSSGTRVTIVVPDSLNSISYA